jgi:hypothetical protein
MGGKQHMELSYLPGESAHHDSGDIVIAFRGCVEYFPDFIPALAAALKMCSLDMNLESINHLTLCVFLACFKSLFQCSSF